MKKFISLLLATLGAIFLLKFIFMNGFDVNKLSKEVTSDAKYVVGQTENFLIDNNIIKDTTYNFTIKISRDSTLTNNLTK